MKHKSTPKNVRRSKAAEGTRGGKRIKHHVVRDSTDNLARSGGLALGSRDDAHDASVRIVSEVTSRAPSPLDELLDDLLLRAPVAREPWMSGVEKALSKFVGELNEIEAAEARA